MNRAPPWYRPRTALHFDSPLSVERAMEVVSSPERVAHHPFYPFIRQIRTYVKVQRDRASGILTTREKSRLLHTAAHQDSALYDYYGSLLHPRYEAMLQEAGLESVVRAFRPTSPSNIETAAHAFEQMARMGPCEAVGLDVRGFFDHLDHRLLKQAWCRGLGVERLPEDHYALFRSLTRYSYVEQEALYAQLGLSRHAPRRDGRYRLCDTEHFRHQIRGSGLIQRHTDSCGIPQGVSLSGLLSNLYLFELDRRMQRWVESIGGYYFRYCDDMLCLVPPHSGEEAEMRCQHELAQLKLAINPAKSERVLFRLDSNGLKADHPLPYLGFLFDGQQVVIRSSTLNRFQTRMARGVRLARATQRKANGRRQQQGLPPRPLFRRQLYQRYSYLGQHNFIAYGLRAARRFESVAMRRQIKRLWCRLQQRLEEGV